MAQLVGVFATSHSPVLITPRADWPALEPRTALPPRPELAGMVRSAWEEHEKRYRAALTALRESILASDPDVLLIVGSDQRENFGALGAPVFEVYLGDRIEASAGDRRTEGPETRRMSVPVPVELGTAVVRHLCRAGFDVGHSSAVRHDFGIGHAVTWPLRFLNLLDTGLHVLPVVTNVWDPPSTPGVSRCLAFGEALRAAVEAAPERSRVAVLASGGLSHLVLDEELDRRILAALQAPDSRGWEAVSDADLHDAHARYGLPLRLNGTVEVTDWIIADACAGTAAEIIDYVPAYRNESGIGVGMCFARWPVAPAIVPDEATARMTVSR